MPVSNGVFTVLLGGPPMKPLTAAALSGASSPVIRVWASVGGAFEQLTPDQPISSVPFALQSESAASGGWTETGGNVYRLDGNVGIGTASPVAQVELAGGSGNQMHIKMTTMNDEPELRFSRWHGPSSGESFSNARMGVSLHPTGGGIRPCFLDGHWGSR